jgi:hypothetical protein
MQPLTQVTALVKQKANVQAADRLSANVYPNPTTHTFTLALQSFSSAPLTLSVRDASGRLIERKAGLSANTTLQLGLNYRPGVYYAELVQGNEKVVVKLLKQSY